MYFTDTLTNEKRKLFIQICWSLCRAMKVCSVTSWLARLLSQVHHVNTLKTSLICSQAPVTCHMSHVTCRPQHRAQHVTFLSNSPPTPSSMLRDSGLWLAESDQVTWIQASDWLSHSPPPLNGHNHNIRLFIAALLRVRKYSALYRDNKLRECQQLICKLKESSLSGRVDDK